MESTYIFKIEDEKTFDVISDYLLKNGYSWKDDDRWEDYSDSKEIVIWIWTTSKRIAIEGNITLHYPELTKATIAKTLNLKPLTLGSMANVTSLIKSMLRSEPEKTFVEVGFMDENEQVTEDGKEALNHLLWEEKRDALKELADKIKKEINKSKKKD